MKPELLAEHPVVVRLPVLWGDQDRFGHVNHTVHIRWFETARADYLVQGGLVHLLSGAGLGPILASVACRYQRQITYPDFVQVGVRIAELGRTSFVMSHSIFSERLGEIAAGGEATIVMFDYASGRPKRIPEEVIQRCEQLEGKSFARRRAEKGAGEKTVGEAGGET